MAKVLAHTLALDEQVVELVQRVGHRADTATYIHSYEVSRQVGQPTWVRITFVADENFSVPVDATPAEGEKSA